MERYERQLRLEGWSQARLQDASIGVVGVGALGCEVSKNLALMGVGEIILVDSDAVELSNLSRQMLFTDEDIGRPKSIAAKEKLERMNPDVAVKAFQGDVRKMSARILEDVDILVSCVDNWPTRRWINSLAVELKKPLVDVSMDGFYANIQVVIPMQTSCIECHAEALIPREVQAAECTLRRKRPEDLVAELSEKGLKIDIQTAEILMQAGIKTVFDIKYTPLFRLETLPHDIRGLVLEFREALTPKMPALQCISAAISGMAAFEVVRILHGGTLGHPRPGLTVYDSLSGRVSRVYLRRNENCFVCGESIDEGLVLEVSPGESVLDLKKRLAAKFMYPDIEIQKEARLLNDNLRVHEVPLSDGDIIYLHTSRRFNPLEIRVKIVEDRS
ncbi:Sulfur carrier protein ThiS adenylyltransferase [archaeon HR01]|nr:Sulfur carrier protein ThiS adenylyltransferase [archaeon HR01]